VLFEIDEHLEVHDVHRDHSVVAELRRALTCALAEHIRKSGVSVTERLGWVDVPCLVTRELINLVDIDHRDAVKIRIGSADEFKAFALRLPSGDVVVPDTFLNCARKGKKATRAGALRVATQQPQQLANESWTAADWKQFERTQRTARKDALTATVRW
jgi:hypothetical protein